MTHDFPNKVFSTVADNAVKKAEENRKRKTIDKAKEGRRKSKYIRMDDTAAARSAYNRRDGGISPEEVDDNIPSDELEWLKTTFYEMKVVITEDKAKEIVTNTRNQADSELWTTERRKRMTASRVGNIAKMRNTTKTSTKVKNTLFIVPLEATTLLDMVRIGNEDKACQEYITYLRGRGCLDWNVAVCELFVCVAKPWLAASPDGIICNANDTTHVHVFLDCLK